MIPGSITSPSPKWHCLIVKKDDNLLEVKSCHLKKWSHLGPVHTTPFLLVSVFVASKLPFTLLRFHTKTERKTSRFCAFTLVCPITKTQRKTSVFVRSHYSVFVKLIVGYRSVFKNLRFCAFTLIKWVFKNLPFLWISTFDSVFENLRFCGVFVRISVNNFTKTEVFLSVFVQKRSSVNRALDRSIFNT